MLEGNAGETCGGSRDTELANDPDMRGETNTLLMRPACRRIGQHDIATTEDFSVVRFKPVTDASSGSRRKASLERLGDRAFWDDDQEGTERLFLLALTKPRGTTRDNRYVGEKVVFRRP